MRASVPNKHRASQVSRTRYADLALDQSQVALLEVGRWLRQNNYCFTTVTPETQRRVNARATSDQAFDLRDVFGWSRPFNPDLLPPRILQWLDTAGALQHEGDLRRSALRFSSLGHYLLAHSAYPTTAANTVFFGPDTLRFADLIRSVYANYSRPSHHVVDIGCGAGAGGLVIAELLREDFPHVVMADINCKALRIAAVNAVLNNIGENVASVEYVHSDVLSAVRGPIDLIIANPPYLADAQRRLYRDGGEAADVIGGALSIRIVEESLKRLSPGGTLVLYTGSAIVGGTDLLYKALAPLLADTDFTYKEIDADVFGDELDAPAYASVERIAAVGLVMHLADGKR